jgi:hypothetical protein
MWNGTNEWASTARFHKQLPPTLHRVSTYRLEKQKQVPQINDISIPISLISPNHFNRFFIPNVEDLFQVGD